MSNREYDFILIGQGLAGTILAHTLIGRGFSVLVWDNELQGSSSSVAAGIINPITGHRLNITENFQQYFDFAERFYTQLQTDLRQSFYTRIQQIRILKNQGQFDYYQKRIQQAEYDELFGALNSSSTPFVHPDGSGFGSLEVMNSAIVNTKHLLESYRNLLIQQGSYRASQVDYQTIVTTPLGIEIADVSCKHLIFCEGYQAIYNPWLDYLPFKLSKGQILNINVNSKPQSELLNWGNWLVRRENEKLAKLGSSYVWNDTSLEPDQKVTDNLLASLAQYTGKSAKVERVEVGIRPTTIRRKPFIGPIGKLNNAYCFNGFGSKGCLLIPYYAAQLCDHIMGKSKLASELTSELTL